MRLTLFALAACLVASAQTESALSWYPLRPGDTWIYQKESLDGQIDRPDIERWTTEETIVRLIPAPEYDGMMATKRTKVLTDMMSPGFIAANNQAKREKSESHILIRRGCVYLLDGIDSAGFCDRCLDEFRRNDVPADYCFPITPGATWGRVPSTGGDDYVWHVVGFNADSFGPPAARTFRMRTRAGSGSSLDRWFTEGVGLVQQVMEHHGTYDEDRRQLLKATINGKSQEYQLTPAHLHPSGDRECAESSWRHFVRPDGQPFRSAADCISYVSRQR